MVNNPWSEWGEYFPNDVLSKKSLSSPYNNSKNTLDVPYGILIKELSFAYFNKEEIELLDYDNPHNVEVVYQKGTTTIFKIDTNYLDISFSPFIFIDAPLGVVADYYLQKMFHEFSTAKTIWVSSMSSGIKKESVRNAVNLKIDNLVNNIKKNTDLNTKGFKPFDDLEKLSKTISLAIQNFLNINDPPDTPEDEKNKVDNVDLSKFTNITASVKFAFKELFKYKIENSSKNYISINANSDIICEIQIKGTLKTLTDYYKKEPKSNIELEFLILNLPRMGIYFENELIISISKIEITYGGGVSVSGFQLHGIAKSIEELELAITSIIQVIAIKKGIKSTPISALGINQILKSSSAKANKVNKFIQNSLESAIQYSITMLLEKTKVLIPSFDLKKFLGK